MFTYQYVFITTICIYISFLKNNYVCQKICELVLCHDLLIMSTFREPRRSFHYGEETLILSMRSSLWWSERRSIGFHKTLALLMDHVTAITRKSFDTFEENTCESFKSISNYVFFNTNWFSSLFTHYMHKIIKIRLPKNE